MAVVITTPISDWASHEKCLTSKPSNERATALNCGRVHFGPICVECIIPEAEISIRGGDGTADQDLCCLEMSDHVLELRSVAHVCFYWREPPKSVSERGRNQDGSDVLVPAEISVLLGQSEVRVTADLWAHLQKQTSAKVARHMDAMLRNRRGGQLEGHLVLNRNAECKLRFFVEWSRRLDSN